jgi:serine protease Do
MAIAPSIRRVRASEQEEWGEETMMYFSRPYKSVALAVMIGVGAGLGALPPVTSAQTTGISQILQKLDPLLSHSSSQGYLGVLVTDVDSDAASKLKLKEVRGAVITLIDHDAPAGQIPLKVNDVVLSLNGQNVEGAEQFGRMLHEIPAGRNVSIVISRDGNQQTVAVKLVDRKTMEHDVWNKLGNSGEVLPAPPAMGILAGGGDAPSPGFHMPFFGSSLNVGAMVEPLTSQMADYLGVPNGVMVKQVARKSEAAAAGLKAFDVILKVGSEAITTTADWDRALRANQGKPVQVTVLRERKQQTLNLQVDSKHKSDVEYPDVLPGLLPDGPCPQVAELDQDFDSTLWGDAGAAAEMLREQAEELRSRIDQFQIDPKQAEQLRQQAEKLRQSLKLDDYPAFQMDQKQLDQLKQQMEQFRQDFNAGDFKIDPKQMDELRKQMQQFRQGFNVDDFKIDPKQMEELKRQMEEMRKAMPQQFQLNKQQLNPFRQRLQQMS